MARFIVIGQLFTQSARRGHPCTLDTFLVMIVFSLINVCSLTGFSLFYIHKVFKHYYMSRVITKVCDAVCEQYRRKSGYAF